MCGINGFSWKNATLIDDMNKAIKHRGPDDEGVYLDENVTLGHRRLSIIDLSPAGRQPMSNEDDSIWIVFNGEIYNFLEIKEELLKKEHKFRSATDTEVIIHAYEEWGPSCVERFNGMWAFAIYDKNKSRLFLSRDRFGVKPLYYYCDDVRLIFSSEIKGLLEHNLERIPNDKSIFEYLAFGFLDHTSETFFRDINRLMPGENLFYDLSSKTKRIEKWYDLSSWLKNGMTLTEEDASKKIQEHLFSSISYRLIADVPVGSCLSGGIDSSTIVYSMRKLVQNSIIKTFSLVFPGDLL
ncbi:MAG: asparagine synthase (glutamine-hydrolyzing), partial [Methanotrichaceae archaeon]|nr:asparagine synthase (glutamine-hydrolyzing) [Methanotrichaceae archaeon]